MYPIFLALHNLVRWIALILGIIAFVRALWGWLGKREWAGIDRRLGMFFTSAMDIQILLGLILYIFLSPITHDFFRNFSTAISNPTDLFFGLFHPLMMILAVVFAHVGSATSRKATGNIAKHQRAVLWYGLSIVVMVLAIPWSRPLLRGF
jgi:hypothetical protein